MASSGYKTEDGELLGTLSSATYLESEVVGDCRAILIVIKSSSVTSGATISVGGGLSDATDATDTDWTILNDRDGNAATATIAANGQSVLVIEWPTPKIRVDCSAYTDGDHAVYLSRVRK